MNATIYGWQCTKGHKSKRTFWAHEVAQNAARNHTHANQKCPGKTTVMAVDARRRTRGAGNRATTGGCAADSKLRGANQRAHQPMRPRLGPDSWSRRASQDR